MTDIADIDKMPNKTRHVTTTSRSLEMISRNQNLKPVSDDRRRW
jgi:hypothetical protein